MVHPVEIGATRGDQPDHPEMFLAIEGLRVQLIFFAVLLLELISKTLTVSGEKLLQFSDILPEDSRTYDKMKPPKKDGRPTTVRYHVTVMGLDSINEESMAPRTDRLTDWTETSLGGPRTSELPQLDLTRTEKMDCTQHYSTGNFTCLKLTFTLKRRLGYYMFHTYIPTCLIVIMSWVSFWIRPEAVPARVTLGVTSLLTLSTQHAKSLDSLPPVSYIKAIDIFMATCTVFVFLSLMEFAMVNVILEDCVTMKLKQRLTKRRFEESRREEEKDETLPRLRLNENDVLAINMEKKSSAVTRSVNRRKICASRIDQVSRVLFPLTFGGLTIAYWCYFVVFN
ncbi:hypothetical protein JTE90_016997 [Oedothorax gibbosus]|uniref:Neurotransmitter-gated ion-channel transmembrane domain-containing protein n=1 Tax=Oedothorax gibbosus TaxID=931172 RepID=A0AAV6UMN5_9ARAC|nr:hypothetical protein JTE90_016997 [Oedothorax gibbosus]